ncbi:uncharacterized protein Z518_00937 [Rhinocladiella mackenziei CBS 650.93]|uniref:Uncharacterized protein n=1 Tax=Rhinocladiella mackenziei CBS 650.93 TaxID=1442369 RepID=A0A0D2J2C5_9EURO|nr:uncharacterized protein Z518_00937 [Rhinocladiella mackenziei CBS 650.93]KIX09856.1 hypothetical protein Z518_00937 [Rhinocladiella mackenziei CBS 650.93]
MSGPELPERTSQGPPQVKSSSQGTPITHGVPEGQAEEQQLDGSRLRATRRLTGNLRGNLPHVNLAHREIPFAHLRVHFEEFAAQLRLHRHHEYRKRMLSHRRNHLQNAVALSARLYRVGSWVHDGLVEISQQADANGFTRVHQHMQDLVDLCYSQWNHEIHALDGTYTPKPPTKHSFLSKLPAASQEDCLELIQTLRSNPRFLVERFKAMSPAQISALSTFPKFQELSESVLTSLSQNRGRASQKKRIKAYSKDLEDYASSFERSNPLTFLLYNVYGPFQGVQSYESQLRFSTWSTICSSLMMESEQAFYAIIGQVLSAFANLHEWPIKDRLELFLMRTLQRGAFLLDLVENSAASPHSDLSFYDPFSTPQAQDFFDEAVKELFEILGCDGGIPTGALHLGRVIIGKFPTVDIQSQFRGHFFYQWFMRDFLRIAIAYPEASPSCLSSESTDLRKRMRKCFYSSISVIKQGHICCRNYGTAPMLRRVMFSTQCKILLAESIDRDVQACVIAMISKLDAEDQCFDPYQANKSENVILTSSSPTCLSICAADIAHVLEALSPQFIHTSSPWDSFLSSAHATFNMQYGRASGKFDKLRRRILDVIEPGHSSKNIHPCQEHWAPLTISREGKLTASTTNVPNETDTKIETLEGLHLAEEAALRLVEGPNSSLDGQSFDPVQVSRLNERSLSDMFTAEAKAAQIKTDSISSMYWQNARAFLQVHFPLSVLAKDDTKILGPLTERLIRCRLLLADECLQVEQEVAELEAVNNLARAKISKLSGWLDKLRIKLWYKMDVVSSNDYEDAKNVATALNNMALPTLQGYAPVEARGVSPAPSRPSTAGTSASSVFDQPRHDTMSILKAPAEHGGPRKLSDSQIEMTKKWLDRNHLENFCKGEERIHRFCMEVRIATRKLVGETLSDSPVLWSSDLFTRERNLYDVHASNAFSAQPSTRAASVWSEPLSSSSFPSRSGFAGSRSSFYSQGSSRLGRDILGSDLGSLISSPGRATTVTTLESGSSLWSPPQSNSRSVTTASVQSRPASLFEDLGLNRPTDYSQDKINFLDGLQQDLTCLLLSDLGCPVWSRGSETDAWMDSLRESSSISERLEQRAVMERLLPSADKQSPAAPSASRSGKTLKQRSQSAAPSGRGSVTHDPASNAHPIKMLLTNGGTQVDTEGFSYMSAFADILSRVSEHVDPNLKLKAIHDFKNLSQNFQQSLQVLFSPAHNAGPQEQSNTEESPRRRSLNPSALSANLSRRERHNKTNSRERRELRSDENNLVELLKGLLFVLQPKTIFRDLQYIATFVSSHTLDNTEMGRAFLQVGLAALAWKDEVCRGMVDVADRIVAKDSIKRGKRGGDGKETSILKAMEYWMIAAREGNAIAQRELASLYLTHPDVPPIVSLPLTLSSEIFKSDMMWEELEGSRRSRQALCLALHWMQQAAENGDQVAQIKLKERRASRSIR